MFASDAGRKAPRRPCAAPRTLAGGSSVVRAGARLALGRRPERKRRLLEHPQPGGLLDVVVRAEAERVDLALGRGIHPPPLVARERPLLVVGGDDVLAQL